MKKYILSALVFTALSFNAKAQEIGVRFGDVARNNFAIDGIFSAGEFSRIHADVSFGNDGVGVDALYDFLYKPLGSSPLDWYVGVGPSLSFGNDFWLGASGEIGLEYKFEGVPLTLGADYRPTVWIVKTGDENAFHAGGFGVNLRYRFK